ncbi:DUF768 domain-containing protein [Hyphomicrobium sp. CS1GBMeth3]|uniref:DUF768 domain-containing protein n=1 Tax=Hyphomicrobium sp. CS1GBMeth3 TaxID=1892845 RepID=UPI0011146EB9|nr:DUF768 domain-containing protein [Hyphomicrobium sp. CS1GBMeth3]
MSSRVTEFLIDWLRWHVVGRVGSAEDVPMLTAKCLDDALLAGLTRREIEAVVGSIEDCIRVSLSEARQKASGVSRSKLRWRPRTRPRRDR